MPDLSFRGIARRYLGLTGNIGISKKNLNMGTSSLRSFLESRSREEHSFSASECIFGWTAAFEQVWTDIRIRIRLDPDATITAATMSNLMTTWQNGIHTAWSDRWACAAPGEAPCRLMFFVDWVSSNEHHVVRVVPGPTRSNMGRWDTLDTGGVAAHEYGHMLGNIDEYSDSTCPNRSPVNTGTVMDNNSNTIPARLMQRFADNIGSTIVAIPTD